MTSETALRRVQARRETGLLKHLNHASPFYRDLGARKLSDYPIIAKADWLAQFDRINTAGLTYERALAFAEQQERDRSFSNTLNGVTVGLSTGTSGQRGVFLVAPRERLTWLGVMLAKLVPDDPLKRRKVAFVLRAGSPLYQTADRGPIQFRYFDMLQSWSTLKDSIAAFAPDMLIAPAGVLRQLADEGAAAQIQPARLISVAECLYPDDEGAIQSAFGVPVGEVYQATEGLIATRCEHGSLHLNEAYLRIEKDWIHDRRTHYMPVVTDFFRRTQPVVRYRLDDILTVGSPCACGRAAETVARIEGRRDDLCHFLDAHGALVPVFPDLLVRAVLEAAPRLSAFKLVQTAPGGLILQTQGDAPIEAIKAAIARVAHKLGAVAPEISLSTETTGDLKRRRVVNHCPLPSHPRAEV